MNYTYNKYKNFIKEIDRKLHPVYLIFGENEFLKNEIVKYIKKKIISKDFEQIDFRSVYGDEITSFDEIISWLYSMPFGRYKLLIIREAEKISKKGMEKLSEIIEGQEKVKNEVIMLISHNKFIDKPNIAYFECQNFCYEEIILWINDYLSNFGLTIEAQAIEYLYDTYGNNLYSIANELDKLINLVNNREIKLDDVEKLCLTPISFSIYKFIDALGNKEFNKIYEYLSLLFSLNVNAYEIFTKIISHFDILLKIKMNKEMEMPIWRIRKYREQADKWRIEELLSLFSLFFEVDYNIKLGIGEPKFLLENLLYKIMKLGVVNDRDIHNFNE